MLVCNFVTNSLKKDPRVIKQISIAKEYGYNVHFLGFRDDNYDESFLNSLGIQYTILNTRVGERGKRTLFQKIKERINEIVAPYRAICQIKPDLIHANDFDTLLAAFLAARKCGCKIIYDAHEIFSENIGIAEKPLYKYYVILFEHYLIRRVDQVISVSNAAADYLAHYYKIQRPTVITNCPYKMATIERVEKNGTFEVLYHGWINRERGYEELAQSAELIDDGIAIAFRGYGNVLETLKTIAREKKLESKIRFYPPVEVSQLVPAAMSSHVGVVITKPVNINFRLTISNKIFEYIHAGLPVIMSDTPEHRMLNERYEFGVIVKSVDPQSLAEAINMLHSDHERYQLLCMNAKKAADELCWENEGRRLMEIYEDCSPTKVQGNQE